MVFGGLQRNSSIISNKSNRDGENEMNLLSMTSSLVKPTTKKGMNSNIATFSANELRRIPSNSFGNELDPKLKTNFSNYNIGE